MRENPSLGRWLSLKYPKIITDLLEKRNQVIGGEEIPLNLSEPNPNGVEYDNLYVDMNGLIHPCSHPEDREAPLTEADMYLNVTKYVDRLFAAVRPRRLLFLAIDGVAPRAKMNQQRARRFRAAQEATERAETMQEVMMEMEALGLQAPPSSGGSWDSNVITPGTEFMDKLSVYIRFYILDRMNRSPAWRAIKVIFSDASEPGEGEHKIMKFIRAQRCQEGYDPNQRHILHGLDADLIMLGLATHEAHFTILREEVTFGGNKKDSVSEARKMLNAESAGISSLRPEDEWVYGKPLQCLHIDILREYLEYEFKALRDTLPFHYDLERIIDDFVFICFFVGNDFLPHLPSLDIRDGAIDFLIEVYKEMLPSMGRYVTSPGGVVNLSQVDILLSRVGEVEDEVFQRRKAAEDREAMRMKRSNDARGFNRNGQAPRSNSNVQLPFRPPPREPTYQQHLEVIHKQSVSNSEAGNADAASLLRQKLGKASAKREISEVLTSDDSEEQPAKILRGESTDPVDPLIVESLEDEDEGDGDRGDVAGAEEEVIPPKSTLSVEVMTGLASTKDDPNARKVIIGDVVKKKLDSKQRQLIEKNKLVIEDVVKLHEKGWKDRYYGDKFKKEDIENNGGLSVMFKEYIKGLCWVLKYYYQGCPSWNWYYPFHYAPFASDLINVDSYDISFELSKPFRPVEQLLAVLPADSVKALPESCQQLMLSPDSPIIDIYSRDIPIDPNGKILPWLWVVLLPFIDETRIVAALKLCEDEMTEEEKQRNTFGTPLMFLHSGHALGVMTLSHLDYSVQQQVGEEEFVPANYSFPPTQEIGHGICGLLSLRNDLVEEFGLQKLIRAPNRPLRAFEDIPANRVMSLEYKFPEETDHLSALLPGVDLGMKVLCDYDGIVARPKLNKGKFNIADIAERMREEKSMRGFQYPHQRMVLAGLGGRSSQPYPQHQDYQRQGQGQGQYPAYNNQRRDGGGDYDSRDSYRAPRQDNYHHSHSSEARNFSFRSNYDEYSRAPERDRGGYTARSDRNYPSRTDPSYQSQYPPHQYPQYPPRQHPPQDSYHRSYPPSQDSGSYRGSPPPSASFNPPPYYPPQHQPQYRDAPPPNWNPPPRGRAPPMPPLAGQMGYPSDSRMAGYSNGTPPQQSSLGDLRNQFSQSAHQGYSYAPAPPAAPSTRDPRMRR